MACFVAGQVGHPSIIGRFLPHAIMPRYANYANLSFAMEFQMTTECRVFHRTTSNFDIASNNVTLRFKGVLPMYL